MWAVLVAGLLTVTAPDGFLEERMRANEVPGLSYALVHDDEVVTARARGVDGDGHPMTPRTPVGFGSVSKPVTALAVLRLVDAGKVALDDPVVRHLPWFRLAAHTDEITVRQLLHQTSGISGADGYARSDVDDNEPGAIRRWVEGLADVSPTARPGERHQYSPANAVIAGAVIEAASGLSFSDFMHREVFAPLDMTDGVADLRDAERMPPGHERYFGTTRVADRTFDMSGLPYGYLGGSVTDLAHLMIPLLDGGRFRGEQFLRAETVAALQRGGPVAAGGRYGLGWRVGTLDGTRIVWHAGAITGYHTVVITAPDKGWAIAVQQNLYAPLRDEAMNATAFGAMRIALGGGDPGPLPDDPTPLVLAGLGAVAVIQAGGLVWTVRRRRRLWTSVSWAVFGALSAVGVGVLLPSVFELQLRHILRFMPDIGQVAVLGIALGAALALTTAALGIVRRARTRAH